MTVMPVDFVDGGQQMSGRHFVLRLDDGSLIGDGKWLQGKSNGAVLLTPDQAFKLGRVRETDVLRLNNILDQLNASLPPAAPMRSLSGGVGQKRKSYDAVEAVEPPAAKRHLANTNSAKAGRIGRNSPPAYSNGPGNSWTQEEFVPKCLRMLEAVRHSLANFAVFFETPVDAKAVPDYYAVVKKPMDLGTLKQTLQNGHYRTPQEFAEDMRQIWTNCHLYNKKETEIDKAGRRAESTFSDRWAKSGFAVGDSRARRNNAGIAAPKYEPNEYSGVPEKKLQRRTSGSKTGRTGSRKFDMEPDLIPAMPKNPVGFDRQQEMAQILGGLDGTDLDGAINIIKTDPSMAGVSGEEMELDFDVLAPMTISKIDKYLRRIRPEGSKIDNGEDSSASESSDDDD